MNKINIKDYPYKYETHMHTSQGSACGNNTGAEMARAYFQAGYTGIIVTDHHYGGNTAPDRSLAWDKWVDEFYSGYEDAKREGEKIGLQVFSGWESGFSATEFLVYGTTKEWMKQHPELKNCTVKEQYELVKAAGGMMIHAHPFRMRDYIKELRLFPECVDGVEAVNAVHSNPARNEQPEANEKAFSYAKEHSFPVTAGSDQHNTNLIGGGMCFKRKLSSVEDFISAVLNKEDYLITDGYNYYQSNNFNILV